MSESFDDSLSKLVKQQRERMAKFNTELDALNTKLLEIESSPSVIDPVVLAALRAQFDRIQASSNAFIDEFNQRTEALRKLLRPGLPSA
jgi:uncharacterized coiled-coil protein SlyX